MVKESPVASAIASTTGPPSTFTVEALISTPDWKRQHDRQAGPQRMVVAHSEPGSGLVLKMTRCGCRPPILGTRSAPQSLPKSPEGQAFAYTLSSWRALVRY